MAWHLRSGFNCIQAPLYDTPGGGAGGGGQAGGVGAGGEIGGGIGGGQAGAGGGGTGGAATIRLTDDSLVDFGDGQPIRWSDARTSRYVPRDAYDRGVKFLEGEATKLEKAWEKYHAGAGPKPQQQPPAAKPDILDEIRDLSVIDGATATKLVRALREEGLGPLAQIVASMHTELTTLKKQLGTVGSMTGQMSEQNRSQSFELGITTVLGGLTGIKGLPDGIPLDHADPFVRELAKDVYLSHDQNSWQRGEFEKMLKARIEGAIALTRALDKKAVDSAKEKRRKFFDPSKGSARPGGEPFLNFFDNRSSLFFKLWK